MTAGVLFHPAPPQPLGKGGRDGRERRAEGAAGRMPAVWSCSEGSHFFGLDNGVHFTQQIVWPTSPPPGTIVGMTLLDAEAKRCARLDKRFWST